MEGFVRLIFRDLLGTDGDAATAVFASMGIKQMKDVLTSLGAIRLTAHGSKRLANLCDRLTKHNTKRNHIVHGAWALTTIMRDATEGKIEFTTTWVRSYTPVHHEAARNAGRYDLPKVGGVTAFTIPQIEAAMEQVLVIMGELSTFYGEIPSLRKPV
jgi:hypothetical protein